MTVSYDLAKFDETCRLNNKRHLIERFVKVIKPICILIYNICFLIVHLTLLAVTCTSSARSWVEHGVSNYATT